MNGCNDEILTFRHCEQESHLHVRVQLSSQVCLDSKFHSCCCTSSSLSLASDLALSLLSMFAAMVAMPRTQSAGLTLALTYELVDVILHNLSIKDLLLAQRVSRLWKEVIASSEKLQRALFFKSIDTELLTLRSK